MGVAAANRPCAGCATGSSHHSILRDMNTVRSLLRGAALLAVVALALQRYTPLPAWWHSPTKANGWSSAQDCRIKGNISRDGQRIYHVPGGRWYDRTRIDRYKGERWFCSEEEARAAGWRKSYE